MIVPGCAKYEIVLLNEKGERFTMEYHSEFIYRKNLNRYKRSKKLTVLSYGERF